MDDVKAAAVQFESIQGDKPANLETIRRFTAQAAARGVQLLVFPECCITGYWFLRKLSREQLGQLAEPVNGPSSAALLELASRHGITIGAGFIEADEDRYYNTYVVAMPDGGMRRHRKLHAFENDHIASGNEFTVFDTPHGFRAGVLICYDLNLVENVRITALLGAEVLLAPHQTGGCRTHNPHLMGLIDHLVWDNRARDPQAIRSEILGEKGRGWLMRWLPSRAHDNGLFLVFANGIGVDDDEIRTGNSMILDPVWSKNSICLNPIMVCGLRCSRVSRSSTDRRFSAGKQVGAVGMAIDAELDRATGCVKLRPGKPTIVAFLLSDESAASLRVVVQDPTNDADLYRSPTDIPVRLGV